MIPNSDNATLNRANSTPLLSRRELEQEGGSIPTGLDKRRVSWAFERPEIPVCADPSLDDMKTLLKKQIRSAVQTPDFIYLTVSALKNQAITTFPHEHSNNHEFPKPARSSISNSASNKKPILRHRPQSSPSSIDTKTKMRLSDGMIEFLEEHAALEDGRSMKSGKTSGGRTTHSARSGDNKAPGGAPTPIQRAHSAQMLRVQSAGTPRSQSAGSWRAKTAKKLAHGHKGYHGLTTSATETNIVPMLMYPRDGLKPHINPLVTKKWPSQETIAKNHPLCSENSLKLRTYTEEMDHIANLKVHANPTSRNAMLIK